MKKSEVKSIISNLSGHIAVKNLYTYNEELTRLRYLLKSVISRSEMSDEVAEQAQEVLSAISAVKLGSVLKNYAEMILIYQNTAVKEADKAKIEDEIKKVDGYISSLRSVTNDVLFYASKLYHILHSTKTGDKSKSETMEALLEAISGYEDKLKPSIIRGKFTDVLCLISLSSEAKETGSETASEAQSEAPQSAENDEVKTTSTTTKEAPETAQNESQKHSESVLNEMMKHVELNSISNDRLSKSA